MVDEPTPYEALEAERAPKRRGRRPGSKNKPKPQPVAGPIASRHDEPEAGGSTSAPVAASDIPAARTSPVASGRPAVASPAPSMSRDEKRFPWVRDRLKPGEEWKRRRLPRICW